MYKYLYIGVKKQSEPLNEDDLFSTFMDSYYVSKHSPPENIKYVRQECKCVKQQSEPLNEDDLFNTFMDSYYVSKRLPPEGIKYVRQECKSATLVCVTCLINRLIAH